jgi:hypothetical protein
MAYPDTVAALAEQLGLDNPVREEDLQIEALVFDGVEPGERMVTIKATDLNRGGRLFMQYLATRSGTRLEELELSDKLKQEAAEFFAPIWNDGRERRMLDAFRLGKRVGIVYKDQMLVS